ncbi:hypothetical protein Aeq9CBH6_06050 [Adlercreutzia equolifaciens]|nr:hypothetical protein Aeq9CBH6_06050 [Adlercreutzia equolifaciens]
MLFLSASYSFAVIISGLLRLGSWYDGGDAGPRPLLTLAAPVVLAGAPMARPPRLPAVYQPSNDAGQQMRHEVQVV